MQKIEVIEQGLMVTLRGEVDSLAERAAAFGAAWAAPGISSVKNEIKIHAGA
jgi:osmotically-inducible protein OsmY